MAPSDIFTPERLEAHAPAPAYRRLHALLARAIAAGELQPGAALPSERDMAASLGISRITVRKALTDAGVKILPGRFLDFLDPWGNRIEIVAYDNIQFTKAPHVLRGMGLAGLAKTPQAMKELADKGMAPD